MTTESDLQPAREQVQTHIDKTVAVSALRKIRGLVDEYEEERRHARRMTPIGIALLCLAVVGVLLSLYVFRFTPSERPPVLFAKKDVVDDSVPRPLRLDMGERTQSPALAEYSERFRIRVENVGAKQFRQVIRDKALYGSTTLTTRIRTEDGTVERVEVTKPSGNTELDDAAQKIVMGASPFPTPPNDLKKTAGIITITREFRFTKE